MNLSDMTIIKSVLSRHGFSFSKKLGQNFIIDPTVCPRMAEESGAAEGVLEIGPGVGVLTAELAKRAQKVCAVELDKRLPPVLAETLAEYSNVNILQGDVLKLDLHKLFAEQFSGMKVCVCANLPYYITSPVIMKLLQDRLPAESLTVMVQKEAAERFCAKPGTRECGAVSAAVWYYAEPKLLFKVGRSSFFPSPNVDSAVMQLKVRKEPPVSVKDEAALFRTVRAAFCQRRKTAVNSISSGLSLPKAAVQAALSELDLPLTVRAEKLTLDDFAALSEKLSK